MGDIPLYFAVSDLIKIPVIIIGYFFLAPLGGILIKDSRFAQKAVLAALIFMCSWDINISVLMINSVEWYRGHSKGFEFNLMEITALMLLFAAVFNHPKKWKVLAPGTLLWILYCLLSLLSIVNADNKVFVWMSFFKFLKVIIIYLGVYHTLRDEDDLRVLLKAFSVTLFIQAAVVLEERYIGGVYQAKGWFEHQNPMAMWSYLCGLPLLGVLLGPARKEDIRWYLVGFMSAAILVQSSLSRAALAAFAVGVVLVVLISLLDKVTMKKLVLIAVMAFVGLLGSIKVADTIMKRFNDEGNTASSETRHLLNKSSQMMLEDTGLGSGWNNFAIKINQPYPYGEHIDEWERERGHKVDPDYPKGVVESHYWLLLGETGWQGFIAYMVFILASLWSCVKSWFYWRKTILSALVGGLFVALILIYLQSNLERVLTQTRNLCTWMIWLALIAKIGFWRIQDQKKSGTA